MAESLIPADHEIRVLLTIKNGQVTERQLLDKEMVGVLESFVAAGHDLGYFVSRDAMKKVLKKAFARLDLMQRIVDESLEDLAGTDLIATFCELHEEIIDTENQLKPLISGE